MLVTTVLQERETERGLGSQCKGTLLQPGGCSHPQTQMPNIFSSWLSDPTQPKSWRNPLAQNPHFFPPGVIPKDFLRGTCLEADVPQQVEVLGVVADVLLEPGVVHVVGVVLGEGEVGVAHHLLARVGEDGAVDACPAFLHMLLEEYMSRGLWLEGMKGHVLPQGVSSAPQSLDLQLWVSSTARGASHRNPGKP